MKLAHFSRRRRYAAAAVVLAGIFLITYLQRQAVLGGLGRWLNVAGRMQQPVDAVMVLGGGASTRPFVAIEIVRARLAKKILIPQVAQSDDNREGLVPAEQEITREIVLRSGISSDAVVVLSSIVDSTEQEARVAAAYLEAHPAERLAVVTSDYHTRRARLLFSKACGKNAGNVVFVGAPTDGFDSSNWWRCESGILSYLTEYLKLGRALVN